MASDEVEGRAEGARACRTAACARAPAACAVACRALAVAVSADRRAGAGRVAVPPLALRRGRRGRRGAGQRTFGHCHSTNNANTSHRSRRDRSWPQVRSGLHDDGHDHRAAPCPLADEPADRPAHARDAARPRPTRRSPTASLDGLGDGRRSSSMRSLRLPVRGPSPGVMISGRLMISPRAAVDGRRRRRRRPPRRAPAGRAARRGRRRRRRRRRRGSRPAPRRRSRCPRRSSSTTSPSSQSSTSSLGDAHLDREPGVARAGGGTRRAPG